MHKNIILTPIIDSIQFREMDDAEYFSSKWKEYISNSRLKLINPDQGGSPELYKLGLDESFSDSFVFGSAVHELVLQPESFKLCPTIDRPTAKAGLMADYLYKFYDGTTYPVDKIIEASDKIGYYKGKMTQKKIDDLIAKSKDYLHDRYEFEQNMKEGDKLPIFLDPASRSKLNACIFSVETNKEIQSLLHPEGLIEPVLSMNEAALFMDVKATLDDKEVILPLKGKLDNFTYDYDTKELVLNDLKTTGHLLDMFHESFGKYHYARQMAFYLYMLRLWAEKENGKPSLMKANMLLVSTVPEFSAGVYKVNSKQMKEGFSEFKDLLQRVAYCEMYGYDGSLGTDL